MDIIEETNKDTVKLKAYNKALKHACAELNKAKAAKNNGNKKRKSGIMEIDNIPLKYSLPPGMRSESV